MSSISRMLMWKQKKISTGVVKRKNADGTYLVYTRGKTINARSAISVRMIPGTKVLLSETSEETYIVGRDRVRRTSQVLIPIDG